MKHFEPLKHINTMQPTTLAFHPVYAFNDGIINTVSGKKVNLLNPTEDMVCIRDIANSLSKICRFNGQTKQFYSVAQHSVLVAKLVHPEFAREALLHDASEAYLGDVTSPLKHILGNAYTSLEKNFENVIAHKFNLSQSPQIKVAIKVADMQALELEHEAFQRGNTLPLINEMSRLDIYLDHVSWANNTAKIFFLTIFNNLFDVKKV